MTAAEADLEGAPSFGRRTDAVTVLLINENGTVIWRRQIKVILL